MPFKPWLGMTMASISPSVFITRGASSPDFYVSPEKTSLASTTWLSAEISSFIILTNYLIRAHLAAGYPFLMIVAVIKCLVK